jgi:hypothetical protein
MTSTQKMATAMFAEMEELQQMTQIKPGNSRTRIMSFLISHFSQNIVKSHNTLMMSVL